MHSFLDHVGFYRCFIRDFSKIAISLADFLQKDMEFMFSDRCKEVFDHLKCALTSTL